MNQLCAAALSCGVLLLPQMAAHAQEINGRAGDTIRVEVGGKYDEATVTGREDLPEVRFVAWTAGRWQPVAPHAAYSQPMAIEVDYAEPQQASTVSISARLDEIVLDALLAERQADDRSLFRTRAFRIVPGSPSSLTYDENTEAR